MPERFASGAYDPEMTRLMTDALERAWVDFEPRPRNENLARSLMATAIIETVEAGQGESQELVRAATIGLITAIKADPAALGAVRPLPGEIGGRVKAIRARVRDERAVIAEMSSRSDRLQVLLGLASIRLDNVERIFLEEGVLQGSRSPAQWDKWLQAAEAELLHAEEHRKQVQEKIDMPDANGSGEQ